MNNITNTKKNVLAIMTMIEHNSISFDGSDFHHVQLIQPTIAADTENFTLYCDNGITFNIAVNRNDTISNYIDQKTGEQVFEIGKKFYAR